MAILKDLIVQGQSNFIGIPTAPTAPSGTSNTQIATTEFVNTLLGGVTASSPWEKGSGSNSAILKGGNNTASGNYSVAEGNNTIASGTSSHAEGDTTKATNSYSHAEGQNTIASGQRSHAEGGGTVASGTSSHAEGSNTRATANFSHAEGIGTSATSVQSHAEGNSTLASGQSSHAEGYKTTASGNYSHSEGRETTASGYSSHAEGYIAFANGMASHAEGYDTAANGSYSHTEGQGTNTVNDYEHASGINNISSKANTTLGNSGNTLFSVGNGYTANDRHNAFEIRQNGDIYIVDVDNGSGDTYYTKGMLRLQDALFTENTELVISSALNDLNKRVNYAIATAGSVDLSNYYTKNEVYAKSETSGATEIQGALNGKQNTLSAGTNISITNNVISVTGLSFSIDQEISSGTSASTNAVSTKAVFDVIKENEEIISSALNDLNSRIIALEEIISNMQQQNP